MDVVQPRSAWYLRWWGITLIIVLFVFLVFAGVLGAVTYGYWKEIKGGGGQDLATRMYGGFTEDTVTETSALGTITVPNRSDLERADSPSLGNINAPIVIVEFLDFKCPNCQAANPILRQVLEKYGSKVRLIARHFPVESTHPGASRFAEVGWCSQQQGRFWPVANYFFDHQNELSTNLTPEEIDALARSTQLDSSALFNCLTGSSAAQTSVNRDYVDGAKFGVRGTPTFFINGEKIEGVIPFAVWESFLKEQ